MEMMLERYFTSAVQESVAGMIGGCVGVVVGHPFDTVKARLQTQGASGHQLRYHGPLHCFIDILKTEGFRAYFKGMLSPLATQAAVNAIMFGAYGASMRILQPEGGPAHFIPCCVSGALASLSQAPLVAVSDLIKLRMQVQGIGEYYTGTSRIFVVDPNRTLRSPWETIAGIYRAEGIRGFGRGMAVTLVRDSTAGVVYFVSYEFLCQYLAGEGTLNDLPSVWLAGAGGMAGVLSWVSIYPLDVVKSRLQTDSVSTQAKYRGVIDCFVKSYSTSGIRVFFAGLGVTVFRSFPVNAAIFCSITQMLRAFRGNDSNAVL